MNDGKKQNFIRNQAVMKAPKKPTPKLTSVWFR